MRVGLASDWPVVELDPLQTLSAAVHRRAPGAGGEAWVPEEGVSAEAALAAHTAGGAWAGGMAAEVGVLRAGLRADFVVLSAPVTEATLEDLEALRVLQTYVDGECAFGCGGAPPPP